MQPQPLDLRFDLKQWQNARWRLSNLYQIVTDEGRVVRFVPNDAQLRLLDDLWFFNLVLKSRQEGFTTAIDLIILDHCVFQQNQTGGIIAHGMKEVQQIFQNKIKFPYERLPETIKRAVHPITDSRTELELSNGSKIVVGTSMRSGTLQMLHVSEMGKIARRFPEKAKEVVTGSFNTVRPGGFIFVESTAEGRDGYFYKMVQSAKKQQQAGAKLTKLDFRLHFFPWWGNPRNRLDPDGVVITEEMAGYFAKLQKSGITLDAQQKAWYVKKEALLGEDIKAEYPSDAEEPFEVAIAGAYYSKQMALLRSRKRIRSVPWIPAAVVNTFWDLGRNDLNAIWFHQFIAGEHRFIRYYDNSGEDLAHYVLKLQETGYLWGRHYLPHDAENKSLERNESRVDRLVELGIPQDKIVVVPRVENVGDGIELVRAVLPQCWFDETNCARGIQGLDEYQKEWDEPNGTWRNHPLHNWASNPADAFRQFAQGWEVPAAGFKRKHDRNWRRA